MATSKILLIQLSRFLKSATSELQIPTYLSSYCFDRIYNGKNHFCSFMKKVNMPAELSMFNSSFLRCGGIGSIDFEWVKDCAVRALYNKENEMIAGYISAPNLSRTFAHICPEESRSMVEKRILELVNSPKNISCLWIDNTKASCFDSLRLWLDIAIYSFLDPSCGGIVCGTHSNGLHRLYQSFGFVCVWEQDSPRSQYQKFRIWTGKRSHTIVALLSIFKRYRKKSRVRKMKLTAQFGKW